MNRYFESQSGIDSYQNSYEAKVGYKKCFLNKICPFLAHSVPVALCFVGVHSFQSLSSKVLWWAVFMKRNLRFGPFGQFSSCISYTWQSTITSAHFCQKNPKKIGISNTVKSRVLTHLTLKHMQAFIDCLWRGFSMIMYCDIFTKSWFLN